jgi:hypothetical protein
MDFLIEGLGRGIIGFFRWLLFTALVETLMYWCGYVVLKIMTLGRYPAPNRDNTMLCVLTALLFFIFVIGFLALYNQS